MKKVLKQLLFLFLLLTSLLLGAGEFRIAATADLHGNLHNLACLAPRIRQSDPDILVDAGDLTGGNLLAELDGGRAMIGALNLLKYNFRVPGNHDFDMAQKDFAGQCRAFKGVTLGGDWRWGECAGVPYSIVSKGKFRVGIIGLTEPNIQRRHLDWEGAPRFYPWERVLQLTLEELRREKVNFIVLIWHNGITAEPFGVRSSMRFLAGVDLVIGAHSHREHRGSRAGKVNFVQPGPHGTSAALVTIHFNDKTLQTENVSTLLIRGIKDQPARDIKTLERRCESEYAGRIYQTVCRKGDLTPRNFPRLGAQALKEAVGTQGAVFVSQLGYKTLDSARSYKDLFRLVPYWNNLCRVTLSRVELFELLWDLHRNNQRFRRTTGVAGFSWNPGKGKTSGSLKAPGTISIAVSSYLMVSSPVLKRILPDKSRWFRLEITERDAVEAFLRKRVTPRSPRQGK